MINEETRMLRQEFTDVLLATDDNRTDESV